MIKDHIGGYIFALIVTFVATLTGIQITDNKALPKEKKEEILKPYKATEQPIDSLQKLLKHQENKTKK